MMGPVMSTDRLCRIEWHRPIDRGSVYHLDLSDHERPRVPWVLELGAEGCSQAVYYSDLTSLADSVLGILELCTGDIGATRQALRRQIICRLAAEAVEAGAPPDLLAEDPADQELLSDPGLDHAESEPAVPASRRLDWSWGEPLTAPPSEGGPWGGQIDEPVD